MPRALSHLAVRLLALAAALTVATLAGAQTSRGAGVARSTVFEGQVEVQIEDHATFARTRHFLRSDKQRIELQFRGKPPRLNSGAKVRVKGELSGSVLALSTSDSSSVAVITEATAPSVAGEQRVAVLLVNFVDDASQPFTAAQANDVVFNQVAGFVRENSQQKAWVTGSTFGWFALPIASTCVTTDIADAARKAAATAGVDLSGYARVVHVFPRNAACGWSGVATVGGASTDAWINGRLELKVVAHELGHNFGLYHAHALDCDRTALADNCTVYDYGDVADVMGNLNASHFSAFQKERLGWLNNGSSPPTTTVSASGSYPIGAYAAADAKPKALKIPRGVDPASGAKLWYYVEYRQPIGFDSVLAGQYASNLVQGVLIRTAAEGDPNSSYMLDMTPNTVPTFDLGDAALVTGQAFLDAVAGVTITNLGGDTTGATVNVTLSAPSGCLRANPGVTLSSTSSAVAAGTPVGYTLTLTNRDSSTCAAATFGLQSVVPAGWTGALANSAITLMPGAAASTTLTVTSASSTSTGTYVISANATNTSAASYKGWVDASYVVGGALAASVTTGKPSYASNETVRVTTSVTSGGKPVANAKVVVTIVKPGGTSVEQKATTDGSGSATTSYRLSRKDGSGVWGLRAAVTYAGQTTTTSGGFVVQ